MTSNLEENLIETQLQWVVVYCRPRSEKKIVAFCDREGIPTTLPLYRSVKKYRGKVLTFHKPLFPGYLFARVAPASATRRLLLQSDHVANLLDPPDQPEFEAQLEAILLALESDHEIRLVPTITEGQRVTIKHGPLRGLEGIVSRREGQLNVVLRLDFIGQAAAVTVSADELDLA